ncbi:MAG TPA: permease [Pseudobacteroides sp.]|uniref:permease n=1 Tax=Pseudobacteroides sp. TaxID=1968840 RepID=UPI002F922F84
MKTQVDLYTGFLSSGKTSLIKQVLDSRVYSKERIVIILCESGEEDIDEESCSRENVYIKRLTKDEPLEASIIKEAYKKHLPHRIIIEQNGMSSLEELLGVLDERGVRKNCEISNIVNVVDCRTFDMLMNITGNTLVEQAANSDTVILNYADKAMADRLGNIEKTIKALNKQAEILRIELPEDYGEYLKDNSAEETKGSFLKKPSDVLLAVSFILVVGYFLMTVFTVSDFGSAKMDLSWLQVINTIFISILMQAFPFLILGVLVSSIIQVFVSREMVIKYFPKSKAASFLAAILGGLFFPVCDCAIVPVATRLVKKGVPLYAAVTFMLAAPIVNPIVIASTLYAFPGQPHIAFYRIYLGVAIAVASGLTFLFFPGNEKKLLTGGNSLLCSCTYCSSVGNKGGAAEKISAIFKHAGEEFFDVGRFLVIGALLTSIFQVAIPKDLLLEVGNSGVVSLVIMMAAAVILSVCSSSDAFIARSFANQFSMGSVMGFLVLGPMIDIKNVLMLLGNFNKRFVAKFLIVVCGLAFAILIFFTAIFF